MTADVLDLRPRIKTKRVLGEMQRLLDEEEDAVVAEAWADYMSAWERIFCRPYPGRDYLGGEPWE